MAPAKPAFPRLQRGDRLARGLVAAYEFYEGSGSVLHDVSGNSHTGATVGGPAWAAGRVGTCIRLNGSTQCVEIPSSVFPTTGGAAAVWFKLEGYTGTSECILGSYTGTPNGRTPTLYFPANSNALNFQFGSAYSSGIPTGVTVPLGTWQHVLLTYDTSGNVTVYYAGRPVAAATSTAPPPFASVTGLGAYWNAGYSLFLKGVVDDFRIYNRALTSDEVRQLYALSGG